MTDDLKWKANTDNLIKRVYQRLVILRNLSTFNVPESDLVNIYKLYIRSVVKQSCVVWGSSISLDESNAIERTQKISLRIIYLNKYNSYNHALKISGLSTLAERRTQLSHRFAVKCTQNEKTKHMFPPNTKHTNVSTRSSEKYLVPFAYHERLKNSAIPAMARQLNKNK